MGNPLEKKGWRAVEAVKDQSNTVRPLANLAMHQKVV
jgi:hypothetical protein